MFSEIAWRAFIKGKRVMIVTHRKELLKQAGKSNNCEIAMVETLNNQIKKGFDINTIDLLIIDEAHINSFAKLLKHYKGYTIGATATPYTKPSMSLLYNEIVCTIDIPELIQQGYLSRPRTFVKTAVDVSLLKAGTKDFTDSSLDMIYNKPKVYAGVVNDYLEKFANTKAIVFCVNIEHTVNCFLEFKTRGVEAYMVHSNMKDWERDLYIDQFTASKNGVLINASIATTGFDVVDIRLIIVNRATTSLPLWLQMCLDMETEVLTNTGFKKYENIGSEDMVAQYCEKTGSIVFEKYLNKIFRERNETESMVFMKTPHLDFRITDGHDLLFKGRKSRTCFSKETAKKLFQKKSEYLMPISGRINNEGNELMDHELSFIGWVMTDGTISKSTKQITIYQSLSQPEAHHESIRDCLEKCGFKYRISFTKKGEYKDIANYRISFGKPRGTHKNLTGWGRLKDFLSKDFSEKLMNISERQLSVLLHSIHLGDGTKSLNYSWTRRSYHISTANLTFANRLQMICIINGYKANLSSLKNNNGNNIYHVHIKKCDNIMIRGKNQEDGNSLSIETEFKKEKVWCLSTRSGTLITRRNGKVLIMGNCGRGSRVVDATLAAKMGIEPKYNFTILDYGENIIRLGHWEADRDWRKIFFDLGKKKSAEQAAPVKECPACTAMVYASAKICPYCNHVFDKASIILPEGELKELLYKQVAGKKVFDLTYDELLQVKQDKKWTQGFMELIMYSNTNEDIANPNHTLFRFWSEKKYHRAYKMRRLASMAERKKITNFFIKST